MYQLAIGGAAALAIQCSFLCERIPNLDELLKNFGNVSGHLPQTYLPAKPLNVFVWNVYKGRKDQFERQFLKLTENSDIIMLQETTDDLAVKPALDRIEKFSWHMGVNFFMENDVATGVMNGTYAAPTYSAAEQTVDVEPFVKSPKVLLINKYLVGNEEQSKELLVINIHGINWTDTEAFERHLNLANEHIQTHTGPILFAGDFNTRNSSRFKAMIEFGIRHGLSRVRWSNPKNDGSQLDDALVRGLIVHQARFNNDVIGKGSDHPAMELIIEVP